MLRNIAAALLLLAGALVAPAHAGSVTFSGSWITCGATTWGQPAWAGDVMPLDGGTYWWQVQPSIAGVVQGATPGAGTMPNGPVNLTAVALSHITSDPRAEATVGFSNGVAGGWDHLTPTLVGPGFALKGYNPPVVVNAGNYIDVHASCSGASTHRVVLTLWYTM